MQTCLPPPTDIVVSTRQFEAAFKRASYLITTHDIPNRPRVPAAFLGSVTNPAGNRQERRKRAKAERSANKGKK